MKWSSISAAAAALLPLASGAAFSSEEYASGEVMQFMMEAKEVCTNNSWGTSVAVLTEETGFLGKAARPRQPRQQEVERLHQEEA